MNLLEVSDYRRMLSVQRLQGTYIHRDYNLASHCYQVAMLFQHFAKIEGIPVTLEVLNAILHHDALEVITGDLIYPVKNHSAFTKTAWQTIEDEMVRANKRFSAFNDKEIEATFSPEQLALFKICDLLELWIFLKEESEIGNASPKVIEILKGCVDLIHRLAVGQFESVSNYLREENAW